MGKIRLTWKDNNLYEDGHRIYRSQSPMDVENLPEPIADLGNGVTTYDDAAVVEGETYHYIISAYRGDEEKYSEEHVTTAEPFNFGPGPEILIAGDMETEGFFGEVPVSELFSGTELASAIGLTAGTAQHSNDPWLKFVIDNELVYIAKKPYRHSISWDDINAVNAVYNDENAPIVEKDGYQFKVTLMTGANTDPVSGSGTERHDNSEWDRLIYRVHQEDPSGDPWVEYTNSDIVVGSGDGRVSWTQETSGSNRVFRGSTSLVDFYTSSSDSSFSTRGWRPALRLVG